MKTLLGMLLVLAGFVSQNVMADTKTVDQKQIELSAKLPQAVVVRVDTRTGQAMTLESQAPLKTDDQTKAIVESADFKLAPNQQPSASELDDYTSRDSWYYYCWNNPYYGYYVPTYYYYGYNYYYQPYYYYNYGYYNYYYYYWRRW